MSSSPSPNKDSTTLKTYATTAPPPVHTVSLLCSFLAIFLPNLPSWQSLDQVATLPVFQARMFEDYISIKQLAYARLFLATLVWATTFHTICINPGWNVQIPYLKSSRLERGIVIRLQGLKTMAPFTCWSWNLLGLSLTLSGIIALYDVQHSYMLRLALMVWQVSAPTSLLVASVVRYAIWPGVLRNNGNTDQLKSVRNLMMHNANVLFALVEFLGLGRLPIRLVDFSLAPLWGIVYVIFAWSMTHQWVPSGKPQFLYFFLDTTLAGLQTSWMLLGLLLVLTCFYGLFWMLGHFVLSFEQPNAAVHFAVGLLVAGGVCRVRD